MNIAGAGIAEKKKKGKPSMGRWRLFRFLSFFFLFACIVITVLAILGPIIGEGLGLIRQTSLPDESLQSSTTLLNAPTSTVVESENITLELWDVNQDYNGDMIVCVGIGLNDNANREALEQYDNSRLFVNNLWVIGATNYQGMNILSLSRRWCGHGELEAGIHLIEFELRDSMFGEPIFTHQWAIEIE
jgi:hypothetical protein